jgi:rhodanese-related sulfurtransferase
MVTSGTPSFQDFNINGVEHISPENAYSELQDGTAIMVDVRENDEYMIEYISLNEVYHFPMSSIMDNLKNIPDDKTIITLCQRGVRSTKVANMFNRNGFMNSINLDGGLIAWKAKGLPFETILPETCSSCSGSCSCSQ